MRVSLLLTCAGKGERAGFEKNKLLVSVNGVTTLERSLNAFIQSGLIDQYVITASKVDIEEIKRLLNGLPVTIVEGGATRTQSVKNGLSAVDGDIVLIHDGARPYLSKNLIKACIDGAIEHGGVIPTLQSRNTVVKAINGKVVEYMGKDELFSVQTPQTFKTQLIKKAFALAENKSYNDDGEIYKTFIGDLYSVEGEGANVKLTYAQDFNFVSTKSQYRFGTGFDCHKLVENRKLILGGIEIPHDKGLLGHSDADVATHALMDSMLGAAALGDIGKLFPDTDEQYRGADSVKLLEHVCKVLREHGYTLVNADVTIVAQKPKLRPFIDQMRARLAEAIGVSVDQISVKATTTERLGFEGEEKGISAHAVCLIEKA